MRTASATASGLAGPAPAPSGRGRQARAGHAQARLVQPAQDDALAQRPRADLELRRRRTGPSRASATSAPASSCLARPDGDPGQRGPLGGRHRGQPRHPLRQRRRGSACAARTGPPPERRRAGHPGQLLEASWRCATTGPGGRSGRDPPTVPGDLGPHVAAQRPHGGLVRRVARRASCAVSRAAPSGSDTADVRHPRRCRRRSPASRRRCRAPAAGRPTSRTSGARPGRSAAPRPAPDSTSRSTPVSVARPGEHLLAVGRLADRGGGEGEQSSTPLSSATRRASRDLGDQGRRCPARAIAPSASRSSARRSSALWE